jgi:hypothetical protein
MSETESQPGKPVPPPVSAPAAPPSAPVPLDISVAWGAGASVGLHGLFLLLLATWFALGPLTPPAEQMVSVDILSPQEYEALTKPDAPDRIEPAPNSRPTEPAGRRMIRPTRMLSAAALADPRSREARAFLPTLDDTERMIQLCDLEALEQVHAWRKSLEPDRVVAYALSEPRIGNDAIDADGAAFRSDGVWFGLAFNCRLSPDHSTVTNFAFRVGAPVPRGEWEARNLPPDAEAAPD